MKPLKVMTVVGTRPEIIRLSVIIQKLNENASFDHVLVHTGQNYDYELNQIFFDDLGIKNPDVYLNAAKETAVQTLGQMFQLFEPVLLDIKPDALLILGDTNSALCAYVAKRHKVPIFHMEAGNRCFDERVPEEINRKMVDHISDINLPYSQIAREYLLKEGLPADQIIVTGSPMREVITSFKEKIDTSNVLKTLNLKSNAYFVVSMHREENIDALNNIEILLDTLNTLCETYQVPVIISTHPRTLKRLNQLNKKLNPLIQTLKPLSFSDYIKLQKEALCVLSDSGTISEETSILNLNSVNIRSAHERPEAMEEGTVILSGINQDNILRSVDFVVSKSTPKRIVKDYEPMNVSDKVLTILLSYTEYINQKVWKK